MKNSERPSSIKSSDINDDEDEFFDALDEILPSD